MKWIFFLFLITSSLIAIAQPNYIYEFNKSGELVKGPPSLFRINQTYNVRIPFDLILYRRQIDSVIDNVLQARIYWQNVLDKLSAFPHTDIYNEITGLKNDLDSFYFTMAGRKDDELMKGPICKSSYTYKYIPSPDSLIAALKMQVAVKIKCRESLCKTEVPLCLLDNCGWSFSLQSDCRAGQDLTIDLYNLNAMKIFLIDWYNKLIPIYPYDAVAEFENSVIEDSILHQQVRRYIKMKIKKGSAPNSAEVCVEDSDLNKLNVVWSNSRTMKSYLALKDSLHTLRTWLFSFVWQNPGGRIRFNPYDFTDPVFYRSMGKKTPDPDPVDTLVKAKMEAMLASKDPIKLNNYKEMMNALYKRDSLKNKMDSASRSNSDKNDKKDSAATVSNTTAYRAFQQTAIFRNFVQTPVSNDDDSIHIRNYYYNRLPDKKGFRYDYPENEKVILALHNKPANAGTSNTEQKASFTEQPLITEEGIYEIGTAAASVRSAIPATPPSPLASLRAINDQLLNAEYALPYVINLDTGFHERIIPLPVQEETCVERFRKDQKILENNYKNPHNIDSLYNLTQWPPSAFEKIPNDSPQLSTELRFPDGTSKPPYQYTYRLSLRDTSKSSSLFNPVDSSGYRVGKRRFVELALGAAYSISSVKQTNISADSNGNLAPNTTEQKVQFVVGLKFHLLRGIYWENNESIFKSIGDGGWKERLSLFLGVSIPDPLKNIYTGVGVDIYPGFNINGGAQWYQYTEYQINNNTIIKQTTGFRPAGYVAVTLDPLLVVNVVKTFF